MPEIIFMLIGLLVGAAGGAMFVLLRTRRAGDRQRSELEARAVAAETRAEQQASLLNLRDGEVEALRGKLEIANSQRTEAQTRLEEISRSFDQQRRLLAEDQQRLKDAFAALSADALKTTSDEFRKTAEATLAAWLNQAKGDFGKREDAIRSMVDPLSRTLASFDQQVRQLESQRKEAYGSLRQFLETVTGTQEQLQAETRKLVAALSQPRARGQWGELTLRRVVEVAGMSDHCDFCEQVTVAGQDGDGRLRPDMVINLPGGRQIVVDAKAPMGAYLLALSAEDESTRKKCLDDHARQIRQHLLQLGQKRYWETLDCTPEMVVLFVPGESFFSAALDCDHALIEDGAARKVVLASPTTLIALLRAVSYGWQQEQVAQNAERISELGRELYDRIRTMAGHLASAQKSLGSTVGAFNRAVGSLETRVLVSARRFKEMGAATGEDVAEIEPIDQTVRELPPELRPDALHELPAPDEDGEPSASTN